MHFCLVDLWFGTFVTFSFEDIFSFDGIFCLGRIFFHGTLDGPTFSLEETSSLEGTPTGREDTLPPLELLLGLLCYLIWQQPLSDYQKIQQRRTRMTWNSRWRFCFRSWRWPVTTPQHVDSKRLLVEEWQSRKQEWFKHSWWFYSWWFCSWWFYSW